MSHRGRPAPGPGAARPGRGSRRDRCLAIGGLTTLVLLRAAAFLALGAEFVADDRGFVGRGQLFGVRAIGDDFRGVRPVAGLVYDVVYGIAGRSPVALFALVTLLNVAATSVLFLVVERFTSTRTAVVVGVAWILMANHTSLVVWGATAPTVVGLIALLLGVLALADRRWALAAVAFVVAIGAYELYAPLAAAACVVAAVQARRDRRAVAPALLVGGAVVAAGLWASAHSPVEPDWRLPDPLLVWMGHLGTALYGGPWPPGVLELGLAVVITAGAVAAALAWWRGERGPDDGPGLVLVGLGVTALGLAVAFTVPIRSFGSSDRLYAASSVGAALVVAGVVVWAWRHWRRVTGAAVAGLVLVGAVGTVVSLRAWSDAGADGAAALAALGRRSDDPEDEHWVLGPQTLTRGQVLVMQTWDGGLALRAWYGEGSGSLRVASRPDEFRVDGSGDRLVTWDELLGEPPSGG